MVIVAIVIVLLPRFLCSVINYRSNRQISRDTPIDVVNDQTRL
jgi:hypothetical protein